MNAKSGNIVEFDLNQQVNTFLNVAVLLFRLSSKKKLDEVLTFYWGIIYLTSERVRLKLAIKK